jgi:hypothetical protein
MHIPIGRKESPTLWYFYADKCEYLECHIGSAFIPKLNGRFVATENFYHTSKVSSKYFSYPCFSISFLSDVILNRPFFLLQKLLDSFLGLAGDHFSLS